MEKMMTGKSAKVKPTKTRTPRKSRIRSESLEQRINNAVEMIKKDHRWNAPFSAGLFIRVIEGLLKIDPESGFTPTLLQVLNQSGMPTRSSFYRWLDTDKTGELRKVYSSVMQAKYDDMHDERLIIANNISDDILTTEKKDGTYEAAWNELNILRAKEMIRVREWSLTRLAPGQYSNNIKIDMEMDASPEAIDVLAKLGEEARQRATQISIEHAKRLAEFQSKEEEI